MTAAAFEEGVRALLAGDAVFVNGVLDLLGVPTMHVLDANVPITSIPANQFPCWVVEQGDGRSQSISNGGDDMGLTIGLSEQQCSSALALALVWKENDPIRAKHVRTHLPQLFVQLFLRNPMPGGVAAAWAESWEPDRGGRHPVHVWRATVRGEYAVPRSS